MQNEELLRAQHELEVSREKYFDLYDLAPAGYLTFKERGRILEANLTAARLLGVARTDLVRQPLTRFILREDLGIFNQHRQQLFATRAPQNCELRLRRPGGTPIWVRVEAILAQDNATGAPVCRMTLSDLTERKQAEAAREGFAQFERTAQLMKCASDSILLTNEHGRILEANDRALETYGYSLADLRQKTVEDLRAPESRAEQPQQTEQLETDGRAVFETVHQRRDGAAFPVEISARFLEIAGVRCRLGIVRDITKRKRAEEALRESEARFRALFEGAAEGVYQSTPAGQFSLANPALAWILGYASPQELIASVTDIGRQVNVDPGLRAEFKQRIEEWSEVRGLEFQVRRKDGRVTWVSENAHAVRDKSGAVRYYEGTIEDITERKRAEEALQESEQRLDRVVSNINDALIVDDVAGRVVYANEKFFQLFRIPEQKLPSLTLDDYVAPEWRKELRDRHDRRVRGEPVPEHFEYEGLCGDGSRLWLEVSVATVSEGGRIVGTQSAIRDITERKRAVEALRESEERHRAILRTAMDGFWRVDLQGRLVEVNEAYCRMSGYSEQELLAMSVPDLEAAEVPADTAAHLKRIAAQGEERFESRHRHKDGSSFTVEISVQYKPEGGGHLIVFLRDITERNQAEKRMQLFSQEIIAAREEERKQVSSVLHHDVGSLAVGISAHLDAIEQDLDSGKPREALQWMKRTRKLFDESVVRLKKLAIELRPPELDVLGLHAALRQYFAQVTERGGTRIHFRETLGPRRVSGDTATILFRVAQEALTNAITHGHATRVDVALSASKKEVGLTIRNNGKGFNPSEHRARAASQMGLRVMREMAVSAGGTFTIDSGQGKGTAVRVRLPLKSPHEHSRCHCR
jgi:PAS domain S-box-containing protein